MTQIRKRGIALFLAAVLAVTMVPAEALSSKAYAADPVAAMGVTQSATIQQDRPKYYQFTMPSGGMLNINGLVECADDNKSAFDGKLDVRIIQQDSKEVWNRTHLIFPQDGSRAYINYQTFLTKGTYTLEIKSGYHAAKCSFKLIFENAQAFLEEPQNGSNNSFDTATPIAMNKLYRVLLASNDTKNYYRIQVPARQKNRLIVSALKGAGPSDIRIYDSNRVRVNNWGWLGSQTNYTLTTEELAAGTYYLETEGTGGIFTFQVTGPVTISKTSIKLGTTTYTYDGWTKRPDVAVTYSGVKLSSWNDYDVTYSNNTNAGLGKVTIKGKGEYGGTVTKTFKIKPTKPSIKSKKALKKGFKVSWAKKKKAEATGYQIQYSTKKNMKGAKTKTVKAASKTIKGLKGKKTYYVRVRAYKQVGNQKVYSSWSGKMKIRTK